MPDPARSRRLAEFLGALARGNPTEERRAYISLAAEIPCLRQLESAAIDMKLLQVAGRTFAAAADLEVIRYILHDPSSLVRPNLTCRREEAAQRLNVSPITLRTRREPKLLEELANALLEIADDPHRPSRAYAYLRTDQTIRLHKDFFETIDIHDIVALRKVASFTRSFAWSTSADARLATEFEVLEGGEVVDVIHSRDGVFTFTIDLGATLEPGDSRYLRLVTTMQHMDRADSLWASAEPTGTNTLRLQAVGLVLRHVWRCEAITVDEEKNGYAPAERGVPLAVTRFGYASTTFSADRLPDHYYGIAWELQ